MRIAVAAFGSEGDVRPFVALTKRLRQEGEDAFLMAPSFARARAEEHGLPFVGIGEVDLRETYALMSSVMAERNPFRQSRTIFQQVLAPKMLEALPIQREALRGVDVVVHHHVDIGAFGLATALGISRVAVHLFHSTLKTDRRLPNGMSLGGPLNRAVGKLVRKTFTRLTDDVFQPVLREAGAPARSGIFLASGETAELSFLAVSPELLPPDPAWAPIVQTGYWFLDAEKAFTPRADLAAFLEEGTPPIAVTFGSMTGTDAARHVAALFEGTERAGVRLLLQAGWGELGQGAALPPHVFRTGYVPHDWLFPKCAAVIHHGGAGTTGAVARAGVPQLIVWHLGDQPMWGALAHKAGLSPVRPVWHRRLSAAWVTKAATAALKGAKVRARAAEVGERIRREDGLGRAAAAIRAQLTTH